MSPIQLPVCHRSRQKAISSHLRDQISHVTFLNRREIDNIELLFAKVQEIAQVKNGVSESASSQWKGSPFNGGVVYSCVRRWTDIANFHFRHIQMRGRSARPVFYVSHQDHTSQEHVPTRETHVKWDNMRNGTWDFPFSSIQEAQESKIVWEQLMQPESALTGVEIRIHMKNKEDAAYTWNSTRFGKFRDGSDDSQEARGSPRSPRSARAQRSSEWVPTAEMSAEEFRGAAVDDSGEALNDKELKKYMEKYTHKVLLVPAVSAEQLRVLPEWASHMFLERLVRIFSQNGLQVLTLLELIDLYSALHRRAHVSWKASIAFCAYDFDEDGVLDAGDLYRTIRQMVYRTQMLEMGRPRTTETRTAAAVKIQTIFRGRKARKQQGKKGKSVAHHSKERPLHGFVRRVLDTCDCVQKNVMDFRFFEKKMKTCDNFDDNFSVVMTRAPKLGAMVKAFAVEVRKERKYEQEIQEEMLESVLHGEHYGGRAHKLAEKVEREKRRGQLEQEILNFKDGIDLSMKFDAAWVKEFRKQNETQEQDFKDTILAEWERKLVHKLCYEQGLFSWSQGEETKETKNRYIEIFKPELDELKSEGQQGIPEEAKRERAKYEKDEQGRKQAQEELDALRRTEQDSIAFANPLVGDDTTAVPAPDAKIAALTETGDAVATEASPRSPSPTARASPDKMTPDQKTAWEQAKRDNQWKIKKEAHARRLFEKLVADAESGEQLGIDDLELLLLELAKSDDHVDDFLSGQSKVIFPEIDVNANGSVSITEFLAWYTERMDNIDRDNPGANKRKIDSTHGQQSPTYRPGSPSTMPDAGMASRSSRLDMDQLDQEIRIVHVEEGDYDYQLSDKAEAMRHDVYSHDPYPVAGAMRPPLLRIRLERFQDVIARRIAHRQKTRESGSFKDNVKLHVFSEEQVAQDNGYMSLYISGLDEDYTVKTNQQKDVEATLAELVGKDNINFTWETGIVWMQVGTNLTIRDTCMRTVKIAIKKMGLTATDLGMLETPASLSTALRTEDMLEQYKHSNGSIIERLLSVWEDLSDSLSTNGLWAHDIQSLGHTLGHGIAELMRIYKFVILLNLGLGAMWFALVIFPRDYSSEDGVGSAVGNVLRALFFIDRHQEYTRAHTMYVDSVSLYYDGYRKIQGYFQRMDVAYFAAILLNIFLSLFVLLHSLGLRLDSLASGSSVEGLAGDAISTGGVEHKWPSLLASYDCSLIDRKDAPAAREMRQGIRQRIEMAVIQHTEDITAAGGWKKVAQQARSRLGQALTLLLILAHVCLLMIVMKYERRLNLQFGMIAPLCLTGINEAMPNFIIKIVELEKHSSSTANLTTTVFRIYLFKMIQLLVMGISLLQIMSVYVEKVPSLPAECQAFTDVCTFTAVEASDPSVTSTNTQFDASAQEALSFFYDAEMAENGPDQRDPTCAEARLGSLFFYQTVSDTIVQLIFELGTMFLVKCGLPIPWKWIKVVNEFKHKWFAMDKGYIAETEGDKALETDAEKQKRLYRGSQKLRKIEKVLTETNSFAQHLVTGKRSRVTGKKTTWWYLEPHPEGDRTQSTKPSRAFLEQTVEEWFQIIADMAVHPDRQTVVARREYENVDTTSQKSGEDSEIEDPDQGLVVQGIIKRGITEQQTTMMTDQDSWFGVSRKSSTAQQEQFEGPRGNTSDGPTVTYSVPQHPHGHQEHYKKSQIDTISDSIPVSSFSVAIAEADLKLLRKGDKLSFLAEPDASSPGQRKSFRSSRSPRRQDSPLTDDPDFSVIEDYRIVCRNCKEGMKDEDHTSAGMKIVRICKKCRVEANVKDSRDEANDENNVVEVEIDLPRGSKCALEEGTVITIGPTHHDLAEQRKAMAATMARNPARFQAMLKAAADELYQKTIVARKEQEQSVMKATPDEDVDDLDAMTVKQFLSEMNVGDSKRHINAARNRSELEDIIIKRVGKSFPVVLLRELYRNLNDEGKGRRNNGHWQDVTNIV
eukprot:COSAG05_NODE_1012_length_6193_cov_2.446997_1_plen_1961_part_10